MEHLKSLFAISIAAILAYFEPVQSVLTAILLLIAINFVVGLTADLLIRRNAFRFTKAFACIREASIFLFLLATAYFVGDHLKAKEEIVQAISTIAYTLTYFYSVNILKNLRQIFPESKPIAVCYDLLSIEILKKRIHANPA
jgi:hypothetical protein